MVLCLSSVRRFSSEFNLGLFQFKQFHFWFSLYCLSYIIRRKCQKIRNDFEEIKNTFNSLQWLSMRKYFPKHNFVLPYFLQAL